MKTGPTRSHKLVHLRSATESDYARLVEIWHSSVLATHHFLDAEYRNAIKSQLTSEYFPAVRLTVAEVRGNVVGFSGTLAGRLEMLFIHPEAMGAGVGSALLLHAIDQLNVTAVDVNEQNKSALGFYQHHGFNVVGYSKCDGAGQPYPLLQMRLEH